MKLTELIELNQGNAESSTTGVSVSSCREERAFSLIELLIAMGLLSFIILGLMLMFNQVQRAFRASMMQTDVMEAGRSITDLIVRDIESMVPMQIAYLDTNHPSTNFFAEVAPNFNTPLRQFLPGATVNAASGPFRTNIVQRFFFTTKSNVTYTGIGYEVLADYTNAAAQAGVGTLYRYAFGTNKYGAFLLSSNFLYAAQDPTNQSPVGVGMHRIADGVVHFRVQAFDTNGVPLLAGNQPNSRLFFPSVTNTAAGLPFRTELAVTNSYGSFVPGYGQLGYVFYSNAVPAYVELEIGFLEPRTLERYRAIAEANVAAARSYLSNHTADVHLFRQRIAIRGVDYMAYR